MQNWFDSWTRVVIATAALAVLGGCAADGEDFDPSAQPGEEGDGVAVAAEAISREQVCSLSLATSGASGAVAVRLLSASAGCAGVTLVATGGTGTVACAVPASGGVFAGLVGLAAGAIAAVTCPRNARATFRVADVEWTARDYERAGATPRTAAALAQCNGCTPDDFARRNAAVNDACHNTSAPVQSCRLDDTCGRAAYKVRAIRSCITARNARETRCFCGGDRGHQEQIAILEQAIGNCRAMLPACF